MYIIREPTNVPAPQHSGISYIVTRRISEFGLSAEEALPDSRV